MYANRDPRARARRRAGVGNYQPDVFGGNQPKLGLPYSVVSGNSLMLAPIANCALQSSSGLGCASNCNSCPDGLNGLGFSVPNIAGNLGWVGYAAAAAALYLLFFKTPAAQRRRRELSEAKSEYQSRVRKIKSAYPRIGMARD